MLVDVAALADVPAEHPFATVVAGQPIVLVRRGMEVCALQRRCPHRAADLARGTIRDGLLICPRHAAAFDMTTGQPAAPPRFLFLAMRTGPARSYPVRIEGGRVLVQGD